MPLNSPTRPPVKSAVLVTAPVANESDSITSDPDWAQPSNPPTYLIPATDPLLLDDVMWTTPELVAPTNPPAPLPDPVPDTFPEAVEPVIEDVFTAPTKPPPYQLLDILALE